MATCVTASETISHCRTTPKLLRLSEMSSQRTSSVVMTRTQRCDHNFKPCSCLADSLGPWQLAALTTQIQALHIKVQEKTRAVLFLCICGNVSHLPPISQNASAPAKRGNLNMGSKTLDCELIGGQTLELSDTSQEGHCHVSKISLSHITVVKVIAQANSFCVTTAGGSYIMTASSDGEAKSWVRAIQVTA